MCNSIIFTHQRLRGVHIDLEALVRRAPIQKLLHHAPVAASRRHFQIHGHLRRDFLLPPRVGFLTDHPLPLGLEGVVALGVVLGLGGGARGLPHRVAQLRDEDGVVLQVRVQRLRGEAGARRRRAQLRPDGARGAAVDLGRGGARAERQRRAGAARAHLPRRLAVRRAPLGAGAGRRVARLSPRPPLALWIDVHVAVGPAHPQRVLRGRGAVQWWRRHPRDHTCGHAGGRLPLGSACRAARWDWPAARCSRERRQVPLLPALPFPRAGLRPSAAALPPRLPELRGARCRPTLSAWRRSSTRTASSVALGPAAPRPSRRGPAAAGGHEHLSDRSRLDRLRGPAWRLRAGMRARNFGKRPTPGKQIHGSV